MDVANLLIDEATPPSLPQSHLPPQLAAYAHSLASERIHHVAEHQMQPNIGHSDQIPPSFRPPLRVSPAEQRPHSQASMQIGPAGVNTPGSGQYSPAMSNYSSSGRSYRSSASAASPRTTGVASPTQRAPPPPRPPVSQAPPFDYQLIIRQQPSAARACGFGERDRRVIDPPPILELKIRHTQTGAPVQDGNAMLALHCALLTKDGRDDETMELSAQPPEITSARRLMGTNVASTYPAKDEHGIAGTFFVFPDLSCRSPGEYRLLFKLLRIDPANMMLGSIHNTVGSIATDVFTVYTAKDFPGMQASSNLLKALRKQGLNVGVKKGSEARKGKGKSKKTREADIEDDDEESSDDHEVADGPLPPTLHRESGLSAVSAKIGEHQTKRRKRGGVADRRKLTAPTT